jgi:hypothetical protein
MSWSVPLISGYAAVDAWDALAVVTERRQRRATLTNRRISQNIHGPTFNSLFSKNNGFRPLFLSPH